MRTHAGHMAWTSLQSTNEGCPPSRRQGKEEKVAWSNLVNESDQISQTKQSSRAVAIKIPREASLSLPLGSF